MKEKIHNISSKEKIVLSIEIALMLISFVFVSTYNLNILTLIKILILEIILAIASIIDLKTKTIPNKLVLTALIVRLVLFIPDGFCYKNEFKEVLLVSIIGLLVSVISLLILSAVSRGGFGMGDVKLIGCIGFFMGLTATFYTLLFGMIICMFFSVILLLTKKAGKKDQIPFGPFIYLGFISAIAMGFF